MKRRLKNTVVEFTNDDFLKVDKNSKLSSLELGNLSFDLNLDRTFLFMYKLKGEFEHFQKISIIRKQTV